MADIPRDFGHAGSAGHESLRDGVDLATAMRDVATDLEAALGDGPGWQTGVAVASHAATLAQPGYVLHVHATAAGSAGPKTVIQTGAPSAGQVLVAYADGVPTLTFAAADAVTAAAVHQIRRPAGFTSPLTRAV